MLEGGQFLPGGWDRPKWSPSMIRTNSRCRRNRSVPGDTHAGAISGAAGKAKLARLLARKPAGIVFNEHTDEDGATVFRHACKLGLEGIVSKRPVAPYRSGPSRDWIKVKNPRRWREGRW
jgi:hypothetical protein